MSKKTPIPSKYLRRIASNGGKAGNPEMKAKAGKAGMQKRWANVPRCPACRRPATKEQREAMNASKHGAGEAKAI